MFWEINEKMMCPNCRTKLTVDPDETTFRWEDAALSMNTSYKYICTNEECICSQKKCFWNDYGDYWSGDLGYKETREIFPDEKYAALNSCAKRQEIEIYGKGLKRKIYFSEWWTLKWLKPMIEFNYKGDDMGNVLGRNWKLKFLYKDSHSDYYSTYYTSPVMMCYHLLKSQYGKIKYYKKQKSNYALLEIWRWFDMGHERTWERKFPKWFFRKFYSKYLNWSRNANDFFDHLRRNPEITEEFVKFWDYKLPPEFNLDKELLGKKCKGPYMDMITRKKKLERIIKG